MSYTVIIRHRVTPGWHHMHNEFFFSYTYNLSKLFYESMNGRGFYTESYGPHVRAGLSGLCTKGAIPILRDSLKYMDSIPSDRHHEYEPSNSWGSFEGARDFVARILNACKRAEYYGGGRVDVT